MQLGTVKGQERIVNALTRSLAANRVAHAYLFEGPEGCGRRTTALALIQVLFCTQPVNGDACGSCPSCRKLATGNHPDLQLLSPLPDKRDISIEQIRELQQVLSLRPYEATRKACLIEPAARMNEKSANALLKTLEEPPGHAIIILLTTQADLLLATIRSRCQHLRFSPLQDQVIEELMQLNGFEPALAAELAPLAEGSMERALTLESEGDESKRRELLACLAQADARQISTIFDAAESLSSGREETLILCTLLISLVRDLLLLRTVGQSGVTNRFLAAELSAEAVRFSPENIMAALELVLNTRRVVQGNANPKLALEHLLLGYDRLRKGI
ncbi:MAG: DNA polymerase III subunit delta' [Geobacter sp.]|nr:DNA polymerase III subunit delta' [Geobacter sp.]